MVRMHVLHLGAHATGKRAAATLRDVGIKAANIGGRRPDTQVLDDS